MSNGTERGKWLGIWLLQIPIYLVTSYLVRTLMGSCYRLIVRSGANVSPNFLLQHFLWVGLAGGFVAGVAGLQILRATLLLLPAATSPVTRLPWKRPQAWTWVLTTLGMAYGVSAWFGGHVHHSVLADSAAGRPDVIAAFFGDGCYLGTFPAGIGPWGLAFDGANIWVSNKGSNTLSKL